MNIKEIDKRYSELAESDCCLSCGSAILFAEPAEGEVCVDLGSGRGTDVIRLAGKVGHSGFVYGIDAAEGMLEKARYTAEKFEVKNVKFICSELENIDLPDLTANLIISNCTINHATDKLSVWREIFRILKNNGRFVVSDIYATQPIPVEYSSDPKAVAECWAGAITRAEYLQILEQVGFINVSILEESKPYAKGKAEVASFTIVGQKAGKSCCCKK
jgi:ubiquinone/menaquinone biosynthesis C-methylase UbiE